MECAVTFTDTRTMSVMRMPASKARSQLVIKNLRARENLEAPWGLACCCAACKQPFCSTPKVSVLPEPYGRVCSTTSYQPDTKQVKKVRLEKQRKCTCAGGVGESGGLAPGDRTSMLW